MSKLWCCGPEWHPAALLCEREPRGLNMPDECALERKKTTHSLLATERRCVEEVMDCKHYGTFSRLVRVTAWVVRAIQCFKGSPPSNQTSGFSVNKLASAEKLCILSVQGTLMSDKHFTSWQKQFNLIQDDRVVEGDSPMMEFHMPPNSPYCCNAAITSQLSSSCEGCS